MFMGSYRFEGEPEALAEGYDRLVAAIPDGLIELQVCITSPDAITVFDTCASAEVFDEFSSSPGFAAAVSDAGLPTPIVVPLGEVRRVIAPSKPLSVLHTSQGSTGVP